MAGIGRLKTAARCIFRRLSVSPTRSYGAAALQYEYEEEEGDYELSRDQRRVLPAADSGSSIVGRGVQWVFMGYPGVQKHVYAGKLAKLLEVPHISMGSLVRQELMPNSSLYKQIAHAISQGKLLPEDIIIGLLSKRLEEGYYRGETGFILDGFPRTRFQAEMLDHMVDIDLVVNFRCMDECLVKKQLGSGICSQCNVSHSESISTESSLTARSQHIPLKSSPNTEDAHNGKLRIYTEQSKPVEDYYRKQKKLLDFHVTGGTRETWRGLLAALQLEHIDVDSWQKLTA